MRQNRFKKFLLISLSVLMVALFFKPYHAHTCSHSTESQTVSHEHADNEHAHDPQTDCDGDCACPQHRVNGCSPITALTKNDRLILLEVISLTHVEALFYAKQSPILEGPFQPPRA